MLQINGKTFMNLQEAVQWLLDNNALPFQSSANYVANTEIGMGTIVNPSPAKVRIGSLIFFADSKVSTVIGLTENGFICSDQYNDLVDDVVYVSNVALNASGHLIVTLSNGDNIDAGLIKQVNNFSINGSQHLIVSYNDGSTTDLGAIFTGNLTISGNITATGTISAPTVSATSVQGTAVTGDSIIENMSGYSFVSAPVTNLTKEIIYAGVVKNGNKITFVIFARLTKTASITNNFGVGTFTCPMSVMNKIYPTLIGGVNFVEAKQVYLASAYNAGITLNGYVEKTGGGSQLAFYLNGGDDMADNTDYVVRFELTLLLSDSLAS